LATAATEKANKLIEENKAADVRVQIANEELAKLRVNFDHYKSECQALKAERGKLVQKNKELAQQKIALSQLQEQLSEELANQKAKHDELSGEFEKTKGTLDIGLKCSMTLIGNLSC